MFSPAVFREMAREGRSSKLARLFEASGIEQQISPDSTVGQALDCAFDVLKVAGHRDEYVYRAALTKKILLGKHSLNTACMLNEFRAGTSKADLVILNGTATVYEIKSERDSLARLQNQVANYLEVFAAVNVIASESHAAAVLAMIPEGVGLLELTRRHTIRVVREPDAAPGRTSSLAIFKCVRTTEACEMLELIGRKAPELPNTLLHTALGKIFASLPPVEVHDAMVRTLKKTRNLASLGSLVDKLPDSLHAAALSTRLRRSDHDRLVYAVSTPLNSAKHWS